MCKVGGPRCNGSHTPSTAQRARRKANKAYRRGLADEVLAKTGDEDLAKRVRQARMTDLHEVAHIAGIDTDAVARKCGEATYTGPDGETATVDVRAPGQTRRTEADEKSKQLFSDVYTATQGKGEPNDTQRALLNGDRDAVDELADNYETDRDDINDLARGLGDLSDEELIARSKEMSDKYNSMLRSYGEDGIDRDTLNAAHSAREELANRGYDRFGNKYPYDLDAPISGIDDDNDSAEYQKAAAYARDINDMQDSKWAMSTNNDFVRNRAMFEELASRSPDEETRKLYAEMAARMDHQAALSGPIDEHSQAGLVSLGYTRAAIVEGRSDKAMSDLYDELDWLSSSAKSPSERVHLDKAREEMDEYIDRNGIENDTYARRLTDKASDNYADLTMTDAPSDMSDEQLRNAMEEMTHARSDIYRHSSNPEVRAKADALAGPVAQEYARRIDSMDDMTNVPAYMWPENTEGKTMPDNRTIADNATFYYGLSEPTKTERESMPDNEYGPTLRGVAADGTIVYGTDSDTLSMITPPSKDELPDPDARRDYIDMKLAAAESSSDRGGQFSYTDTSDAADFATARNEYNSLAGSNVGRLGGNPAQAADAKKYLDTHPAPTGNGDDDIKEMAERVRARNDIQDAIDVRTDKETSPGMRAYARHQAMRERQTLARALDSQLRAGGSYNSFVESSGGMDYTTAFDMVERRQAQGIVGDPETTAKNTASIKKKFAEAAESGKEPNYSSMGRYLKSKPDPAYERAEKIVESANDRLGTGDYGTSTDSFVTSPRRTSQSWNKSAPSDSFEDIIDHTNEMNPAEGMSWKTRADSDIAASYTRNVAVPKMVKTMTDDVEPVGSDGTYTEVRVSPGSVQESTIDSMLKDVEDVRLDSYNMPGGAMEGITRNAAGKRSREVAADNYSTVYAHTVSTLGERHADENEYGIDEGNRADYEASTRLRTAYINRLSELYSRAESGDRAAAEELVDTAAAANAEIDSVVVRRQYVAENQESLF